MSLIWPTLSVALLVTNLGTLLYFGRKRQTNQATEEKKANENNFNQPLQNTNEVTHVTRTNDSSQTDTKDDLASTRVKDTGVDSSLTVANSPLRPDAAQTFRTTFSYTPNASGVNSSKLTDPSSSSHVESIRVERIVHCMDTNTYLKSIAVVPKVSSTADANEAKTLSADKNKKATPTEDSLVVDPPSSSSLPLGPPRDGTWNGCSVITSVPDVSETGLPLAKWRHWFRYVCIGILQRVPHDGVGIFYQTDIRSGGEWISKAFLVMQAAEHVGMKLIWHKIVLVNNLDTIRGSTSSYVHLLCVSHRHVENPLTYTPDLIAHRGTMLWKRAMGLRACEFACKYVKQQVKGTHTIVDPFCGSGSILSMSNMVGLHSIGVDHCRSRCVEASTLKVDQLADFGGAESEQVKQFEANRKEVAKLRKQQRLESGRTQKEQQMWEKEQKRIQNEKCKQKQEESHSAQQ